MRRGMAMKRSSMRPRQAYRGSSSSSNTTGDTDRAQRKDPTGKCRDLPIACTQPDWTDWADLVVQESFSAKTQEPVQFCALSACSTRPLRSSCTNAITSSRERFHAARCACRENDNKSPDSRWHRVQGHANCSRKNAASQAYAPPRRRAT